MKTNEEILLKKQIKESGLMKNFIADKIEISAAHLSMMLNGNATMPESVRTKINSIINQAKKITV